MTEQLQGKRVAILVSHGFEQSEMTEPRRALDESGAETVLVSPVSGRVKGWRHKEWGDEFPVDLALGQARAQDFDALVLPGGQMNPDNLRMNSAAVDLVQGFIAAGKPVAAICHGPWLLVEADAVRGRRLTSWPSVRTDLRNAGAQWVDEETVVDGNLLTSRKPDDLPAFNAEMIALFAASGPGGRPGAQPEQRPRLH
ncbi:type 1 glutamine amidotransferase domain-containing protein [Alkalilimnicola sp. S0819]|uniref:type 1 glutamine amidotransferase domain-containing protein n=1 Tax=Alkalilimnicola sp. S0819 TaxID=2613922 RepID=UPI001261C733|nr:type 1 glutamine amidotransferase domain-containing protein [Alkalilimnicola sp. S0819]KAB7624377.1 type 1 glutamine amidotransferase [Alkalilimnicola sp. S0819]MPQ16203.1 DJ-1/PfpI/YhbO family deglycase/protease [Alkalilimnicola sp. S0819]